MREVERIRQVGSEPIPELDEFLQGIRVRFRRREGEQAAERYLSGLLSEHPNKNCETLAEILPETSAQSLQGMLTVMVWDEEALNRQRVTKMLLETGEGDGVLIIDDTGFAKQGSHSVGVARQYSGTIGKVGNCQVTVNCHYAERTLGWPVATRLYLPASWSSDTERRKKAGVPETLSFQTKWQIALALLDEARRMAVTHKAVVADCDYGDNPLFLNGLEDRQERYVVEVRQEFTVSLGRGRRAASQTAAKLLESVPSWQWQTIRWQEGSRGSWLRAKFAAVRCYRVDGEGSRHRGWLIGQRPARRGSADRKYLFSNFPASSSLAQMAEYAHRRHWVEQYHEEAKGELGWDQYQGRLWRGFHREAVLVMMSYSFLVWLEWRERQQQRPRGRRRGAFSPSDGPKTALHRQRPPTTRRSNASRSDPGELRSHTNPSVPHPYAELTE